MSGSTKFKAFLKLLAAAMLTAIVTISIAFGLSTVSGQSSLAARVDVNSQVTKHGVAAIACILAISPDERTEQKINFCLDANHFTGVVAQYPGK